MNFLRWAGSSPELAGLQAITRLLVWLAVLILMIRFLTA